MRAGFERGDQAHGCFSPPRLFEQLAHSTGIRTWKEHTQPDKPLAPPQFLEDVLILTNACPYLIYVEEDMQDIVARGTVAKIFRPIRNDILSKWARIFPGVREGTSALVDFASIKE